MIQEHVCIKKISYLKTLVEADKDGRSGGTITLGTNQPVGESLPKSIIGSVENVEEDGSGRHASMSIIKALLLALGKEVILPLLELVAASPDDHTGHKDNGPAKSRTVGTLQPRQVKNEANEKTTQHLGKPVECAIERPSANVEGEAVDVVLLVAVKYIGREEQRDHASNLPLHDGVNSELDGSPESVVLGLYRLVQLSKSDALRRADEDAKEPAKEHDDHQGNISRVIDGTGFRVEVEAEGHERANTTTEVEDDPENGNGSALLRLVDIGRHDGALHDPNEGSTNTENCTRGNYKGAVLMLVEVKQAATVESIRPAANKEADARPNPREDGTNDKERGCGGCRKESDRSVRSDSRVNLTGTTDARQGIVHLEARVSGMTTLQLLRGAEHTPGRQKQMKLMRRICDQG